MTPKGTKRAEAGVTPKGGKRAEDSGMTRTFVAFLIPSDWRDWLGEVSLRLADRIRGVSWVKPESIHITIRFLGYLGDSGVRRVCEAVRRDAEPLAAPRAGLGALGAFPKIERPRVIWVGLADGAEGVNAVAKAVNDGLKRDGFGPPDRAFRAHLTLARVREHAEGLESLRDARLPPPPPAAILDTVAVMKSTLHPTGARYNSLEQVRLRPSGPGREA